MPMAYRRWAWLISFLLIISGLSWVIRADTPPAPRLAPRLAAGGALAAAAAPQPEGEGWSVLFADDFEGDYPGPWRLAPEPWLGQAYWERRDCRAHSGTWSLWCAGSTYGEPTPACSLNYGPGQETWLIAGPFDLSRATAAELTFQHWTHTAERGDFLAAAASIEVDATSMPTFYGITFDGDYTSQCPGGWCPGRFDLSQVEGFGSFCGQPRVWIAFYFQSNGSLTAPGAFVDDVALRIQTGESTATPTASVTPAVTPTPEASGTPTVTATPTASLSPTPSATPTAGPTATASPSPSPTATASPTPTATPSPTGAATPTATPIPPLVRYLPLASS